MTAGVREPRKKLRVISSVMILSNRIDNSQPLNSLNALETVFQWGRIGRNLCPPGFRSFGVTI